MKGINEQIALILLACARAREHARMLNVCWQKDMQPWSIINILPVVFRRRSERKKMEYVEMCAQVRAVGKSDRIIRMLWLDDCWLHNTQQLLCWRVPLSLVGNMRTNGTSQSDGKIRSFISCPFGFRKANRQRPENEQQIETNRSQNSHFGFSAFLFVTEIRYRRMD